METSASPTNVREYHAMIGEGVLTPDDRVELIDGSMLPKARKSSPHCVSNYATRKGLERIIPNGWYVDTQKPITLATSEPEPDVAVIRGDSRDDMNRHPGSEVAIVVEISDTTLERDSFLKKRIYAAAAIGYYWIVDLMSNRIEVYSEPQGNDYKRCDIFEPNRQIPLLLDGQTIGPIPTNDLLP